MDYKEDAMNKEKIAIVVDSGTNVPDEYVTRYDMHVLPMVVIYKEKTYLDQIEITAEEVCERFKEEIPSTSLPSPQMVYDTFNKLKEAGYEKVITVCVSSGLSNTYSMICGVANDMEGLEIEVIDTKNIGVAAGMSAIMAAELIEKGYSFKEICDRARKNVERTKVFFCVDTLEYLKKGGRIGLVASLLGSALNLKPVISCNDEGVYYTVSKARGRAKSLTTAINLAVDTAKDFAKYNIAVVHVAAKKEAEEVLERIKELLPDHIHVLEGQISSALTVHTGPGLIGIGIQCVDW